MSAIQAPEPQSTLTQVIDGLTDQKRRDVVATLLAGGRTLTERELAERLAGADQRPAFSGEPATVRASLRHVHLPKLAALDLVSWDRTAETVGLGDNPLHDDSRFHELLEGGDRQWEVAAAVHGDAGCRATVEAIVATGPTSRTELANTLAERDGESGTRPEDVAVTLHHLHLPKLAEAGLIDYDAEDGAVVPTDDAEVPLLETPKRTN